jgi:hypothetical protein
MDEPLWDICVRESAAAAGAVAARTTGAGRTAAEARAGIRIVAACGFAALCASTELGPAGGHEFGRLNGRALGAWRTFVTVEYEFFEFVAAFVASVFENGHETTPNFFRS